MSIALFRFMWLGISAGGFSLIGLWLQHNLSINFIRISFSPKFYIDHLAQDLRWQIKQRHVLVKLLICRRLELFHMTLRKVVDPLALARHGDQRPGTSMP
jgi:hypothetical protein